MIVRKGITIIASNINNINFLVMGRMGVTEILVIVVFLLLIPFLTHRFAYRYGKTSGRNEVLEEIREEEKREKLKREKE